MNKNEIRNKRSFSMGRLIDAFNEGYPTFLSALVNLADVILTLIRTIMVTMGIPISLSFILYVESDRIRHGIELFEANSEMARLAAWVLVILNVVLELLIVYEEDKYGYQHPAKYRTSLRTFWGRVSYLLGVKREEKQSPAHVYMSTLKIVTYSILLLALLGSMREQMEATQGAWHVALVKILTESSLKDFVVWIGGTIFAFTLVVSAQSLSNYVATHTTKIVIKPIEVQPPTHIEERQLPIMVETEEDTRIVSLGEDLFLASCSDCSWSRTYTDDTQAKRGLVGHSVYCAKTLKAEEEPAMAFSSNGRGH